MKVKRLNPDLPTCPKCPSSGTIVEMKLCCRVYKLIKVDATTEKFKIVPSFRPTTWRPGWQ